MGEKEDFSQGLKLETAESIRGDLTEAKNPISLYKIAIEVLGKMEKNFDDALGNKIYDYFDGNVNTDTDRTDFETQAQIYETKAKALLEKMSTTSALYVLAHSKLSSLGVSDYSSVDQKDLGNLISELLQTQNTAKRKVEQDLSDGTLDNENHVLPIVSMLGQSLDITHGDKFFSWRNFDSSHDVIMENLGDLSLIPKFFIEQMKKKGLKIRIGDGDMLKMSSNPVYRSTPRGWNLADWSGVPGCYNPAKQTAYAGVGGHGASSLSLHEYGHGVGDILGLDNSQLVISAHIRLFDKLSSYLQQGGPGGVAGRQEFLAESFSDFFKKSQEKFIKKYDNRWYSDLKNIIDNPNSTI